MYKTIIAVVGFLVIALIVQLYQQEQLHLRIAQQQQEAEKAHSDSVAKALDAERERQRASGQDSGYAPAADNVVPDSFRVPDGPPREFDFTVDSEKMLDVIVAGHFSVAGDHPAGIDFYIFDEDDYENWLDGNNAVALYSAGRKASGDVNVRITKSGRYNLVFKNSSSRAADVNADIQLRYEKLTPGRNGAGG